MKKENDPFSHPFFTDTDNYIKKKSRKHVIMALIFVLGVGLLVTVAINDMQKETEIIQSCLGKKVKIGDDTLTVIDYSSLKATYTLSNGLQCDMKLIEKSIINTK